MIILKSDALVVQWIERSPAKAEVARSSRAERTNSFNSYESLYSN